VAEFLGSLPWYEEYPTSPPTFILNGFIYSLLGTNNIGEFGPYVIGTVPSVRCIFFFATLLWGCAICCRCLFRNPSANCSESGVADPDPSDPYVFGPPVSGSVSQELRIRIRLLLSSNKNSKKNLDSYCFVTSF
jgi:hypothetical protein